MKTAIIKALIGSYDFWAEPRIVEPNVDYHLFTDQNIKSKAYQVHQVNRTPKIERHIKIEPWKYLPNYDRYIWVDANMHPKQLMPELPDADIVCLEHPARDCVYQELAACIQLNKDNPKVMIEQVAKYRAEGYPEHGGMVQTGFLVRNATDEIKEHASIWWGEVSAHSRRDQLSFNYALAKAKADLTVFAIGWTEFQNYYKLTPHKR